jgi:hypothetical protein
LETTPVNSSQEIKESSWTIYRTTRRRKAEQIFLRGFDIDHGTDIAISGWNACKYGLSCTWAMLICILYSGNGRKDRFWKRDVLC